MVESKGEDGLFNPEIEQFFVTDTSFQMIIYGNRSYSSRCARKDEIAYLQRKKSADVGDDLIYGKDHL